MPLMEMKSKAIVGDFRRLLRSINKTDCFQKYMRLCGAVNTNQFHLNRPLDPPGDKVCFATGCDAGGKVVYTQPEIGNRIGIFNFLT